jgi:hypothetical protein
MTASIPQILNYFNTGQMKSNYGTNMGLKISHFLDLNETKYTQLTN